VHGRIAADGEAPLRQNIRAGYHMRQPSCTGFPFGCSALQLAAITFAKLNLDRHILDNIGL
jgi:hypothetical protein